jgi:hypoxanthine-DNA glycosylase
MIRKVEGFLPIVDASARTVILGTMPGEESLRTNQYYANSRNTFWKIMARLLGFPEDSTYHEKTATLKINKIALWDVMHSCERSGSLDGNIEQKTIEINDFVSFFQENPRITKICFNGVKAEKEYKRNVFPNLSGRARDIILIRLPSTSPAMARISFEQKVTEWSRAIKTTGKLGGN